MEEAKARDRALRDAYKDHREFYMVNNDHDFQTKVDTTINIASSILGLPTDIKLYKKYLVDSTTAYVENEDDFGGGSHSVIKFLEDS